MFGRVAGGRWTRARTTPLASAAPSCSAVAGVAAQPTPAGTPDPTAPAHPVAHWSPAGLPLPQRPPPPVQTKLAMTGPAELVTCDQTIEHTFRLFKQTLGWTRPQAPHPPGRRPLDLAGHRLPLPAPPRSAPHRRPAPSLGEARGPGPPHPRPGPPRIPEHPREDHPPSRYTKTLRARPGTPTWLQEPPRRTTLRRWKDRERDLTMTARQSQTG